MSDRIVGIDLGTTNSAVSVVRDGSPLLLSVDGETLVPSVVGISPSGDVLVGTPARNQWVAAPESTVRSIKRRMGRAETVPMAGKDYRPQEVSAFILRRLREAASEALGEPVDRAVITVPAYFTEVQRQATIEAGEIAGWRVERIINEPTSAALAYGVGRDEDRKMLVYDLGGGTFDVSVVEMCGGVIDVRSTAGDNQLGGDDFDEMLASMLAVEFAEEHGIHIREDSRAWPRVLRAAEEAKIRLSTEPFTMVSLEFLTEAGGSPRHLRREVAREELEELVVGSIERTLQMTSMALADAELESSEIDVVLLVGGATRMPLVSELVRAHLGRDPHREIDPDAVVALGAAVQAAIVAGEPVDAVLVDVTPLSLGIAVADMTADGRLVDDIFAPLIARNTTIPAVYTKAFSTVFPGQLAIKVQVYQGESAVASANTLLGEFDIEDLKPNTPIGVSEVTVRFAIDVNGILEVTATERGTSNQVSARLRATRQRMSPEEIEVSRRRLDEAGVIAREIDADELDEAMDPGTSALLDRAAETLYRDDVDPGDKTRIAGVRDAIVAAIRDGDPALAEDLCVELIDRLIGVES